MSNLKDEIREKIDWLNARQVEYDAGAPTVSDEKWDEVYFELQAEEKKSGIIYPDSPTQAIQFQTVSKLNKKRHNHPMLSLYKTKSIEEVSSFVKGHDWLAMFKMDGLTCSLTYENGELIAAETRGDGVEGEDIYHNALVISSIPKSIPNKSITIIDGEIICTKDIFNKYFASEYKNPRNFAAGSVRQLSNEETFSRKLTFVAWDLVEGIEDIDFFMHRLEKLDDWGFTTVPRIGDAETVAEAVEWLNEEKEITQYPIDGYVFKFESKSYGEQLGRTGHHFKNAIAYKFYDETYFTRLKYIQWQIGRGEELTPVAIFDPVEIEGTTVDRASLHNYSVMKEILGENPYGGEPIEVYKANEIIPQIKSAEKLDYGDIVRAGGVTVDGLGEIPLCPACGGVLEKIKSESGVENICCANPCCEGKLINRIDHFVGKKGLDIKGLSKATIEKLIDWNWLNDIEDVFKLTNHKTEWVNKNGFGEKSVKKILEAIEESKHCTLEKFISSLGITLIGERVAKEIVKHISTWEEFRQLIEEGFDFSEWDSFGVEKAYYLSTYDYTLADKLIKYCIIQNSSKQESQELLNKVFCITGRLSSFKNRAELQAIIEEKGGKVVGSITNNVNYLINNDIESQSSKNRRAKELEIPIISEEDFIKNFLDI